MVLARELCIKYIKKGARGNVKTRNKETRVVGCAAAEGVDARKGKPALRFEAFRNGVRGSHAERIPGGRRASDGIN